MAERAGPVELTARPVRSLMSSWVAALPCHTRPSSGLSPLPGPSLCSARVA